MNRETNFFLRGQKGSLEPCLSLHKAFNPVFHFIFPFTEIRESLCFAWGETARLGLFSPSSYAVEEPPFMHHHTLPCLQMHTAQKTFLLSAG
jgi:hypothetical protein